MDASERDPSLVLWRQGDRAARWAAQWEVLNRQLRPATEVLLAAAGVAQGERVLDVGCGTGPTTRLAAEAVGAGGSVVGVDVASEMLDVAKTVPVADGAAAIEWVLADAETWPGIGEPFDLVLSRFGVMFFDDPDTAFANLRRLTAPGGRLCVVTWQQRPATPLFEVPLSVVLSCCSSWGLDPELPAADGGPFSLHDEAVRDLLARTGWHDVTTQVHEVSFGVGGGTPPAEAADLSLETGSVRTIADDLTDEQREELRAAMEVELADHVDADGLVRLDGAIAVATARA